MINDLIKAIYIHTIIMENVSPFWIIRGPTDGRYIYNNKILNTEFISIDGHKYHIGSGKRPSGLFAPLTIPLILFLKDERGEK